MIRDLLFVEKPVKYVNICAILFQWVYILFNLIMMIFFEDSIAGKCIKGFTALAFMILNFAVINALYNNARSKEGVDFMDGLVEIYANRLKNLRK